MNKNKVITVILVVTVVLLLIIIPLVFGFNPELAVRMHNWLKPDDLYTMTNQEGFTIKTIDADNFDMAECVTTLGQYKDLMLSIDNFSVTNDGIEDYVNYKLEDYTDTFSLDDEEIGSGDELYITYTSTTDTGNVLTENQETAFAVDVTENGPVSENLKGHKVGDTIEFDVDPKDIYSEEDLANLEGVKSIHYVIAITEGQRTTYHTWDTLTDEYVSKMNVDGAKTKMELWDLWADEYSKYMAETEEYAKVSAISDKIRETSIVSIPNEIVQRERNIYIQQFKNMYCLDQELEDYLWETYQLSLTDFYDIINEDVQESLTNIAIAEAIIKETGYSLSDEELNEFLKGLCENSSYSAEDAESIEDLEKLYSSDYMTGKEYLERMARCQCVMKSLVSQNNFTVVDSSEETFEVDDDSLLDTEALEDHAESTESTTE